jgi:pimeloyl-ACP methyl ester carboxylesterase
MLTVSTSHGPIPVWATLRTPETVSLIIIRGAMAEYDQLLSLQRHPTASVMLLHLPGMHTPFLSTNSVEVFADAYDQVLERLGVAKAVVVGLSAGGLVALAMKHRSIRRLILADTPLSTGDLWPLEGAFKGPASRVPAAGKWFDDILGYTPHGWEDRGYRPLLDRLNTPAMVLLGGLPLQPHRPFDRMPSLVTPEDRAAYERHPLVETQVLPDVGHNIARDGTGAFTAAITETFEALEESDSQTRER